MDGNILMYIVIGLVVLFIIYSMMNKRTNTTDPENRDYRQRGDESPRYDDKDISGRGSFGGDTGRTSNSSNQQFEWMNDRRKTQNVDSANPAKGAANPSKSDSPDVSGRGSFGRDKD